jgi:hypothetical protein
VKHLRGAPVARWVRSIGSGINNIQLFVDGGEQLADREHDLGQ